MQFEIKELELSSGSKSTIECSTKRAVETLKIEQHHSPDRVMFTVHDGVKDARKRLFTDKPYSLDYFDLAVLWGNQIIRRFNWYWADITIGKSYSNFAVISPNQDMVMPVVGFTDAIINSGSDSTVIPKSYNMLFHGELGPFENGAYENILANIYQRK